MTQPLERIDLVFLANSQKRIDHRCSLRRCIDAKIANINRHTLHHPVVQNENIRRALVNRFPFSIYFEIKEELITIFANLHQRRSPEFWKSRI